MAPTLAIRCLVAAAAVTACDRRADPLEQRDQAITHGSLDDGDDAVVGLVADNGVYCTGTLIAPRVVVTAAHCLVSRTVSAVVLGPDQASGRSIAAVGATIHPAFDPRLLTDDVGLVLLAEPAPEAPMVMSSTELDATWVGGTARLAGFGLTGLADGAPRKHQGTATIDAITAGSVDLVPGPSLTCGGDSGGPVLLAIDGSEVLIGVTSAGDRDCARFSHSTRLDVERAWILDFVAATQVGGAASGDRCFYPEQCTTGRCFAPPDAQRIGYCSGPCEGDDDCAAGMRCAADPIDGLQCRYPQPSPGALGEPCDSYADCDSRLCGREESDGAKTCTVTCSPDQNSCASGFACRRDADQATLDACFRPPASGGCASTSGGMRPMIALLLVVGLRGRSRITSDRSAPACGRGGSGRRPTPARPR